MDTQRQVTTGDLRDVDIFIGLSDDDLEQIANICRRRSHQAGEHCTNQGITSDELQIVDDGKVAIEMSIEVAPFKQTLRIATLTKGNILDFSVFLEPHTPTSSATCLEKVDTICIKSIDLENIFKARPSMEHKVMKNLVVIMGSRFRTSRIQLARFVAETVKQERK